MLVNCVAYKKGEKIGPIPLSEARDYVNRRDCFVWIAIRDPEPAELDFLQRDFDLHELAVEDVRHGQQRPKIEEYGKSLFVVMQPAEIIKGKLHTGELAVFAGEHYVVSVRQRAQQSYADVRTRAEEEPELLQHGPAYVLYALMDAVVDRYFPVVGALTDDVEELEEALLSAQNSQTHLRALYELKRKLTVLKHAVDPLREVAGKLHGGRVPSLCAHLQDYFRDVDDHLVRLSQTIDHLHDMVITAISINISLITVQENEVTKRLAAYAALFAVPTMISGIYGMNFTHFPELQWIHGYPVALGSMALIDLILFILFRRAKWL